MGSLEGFFQRQALTPKCDCEAFQSIVSLPDSPVRKQESGLWVFEFKNPTGFEFNLSLWFCPLCGGVLSDISDFPREFPEDTEIVHAGTAIVIGIPSWLKRFQRKKQDTSKKA
jgi:hypothetical protein